MIKILVVEDENSLREDIIDILSIAKYEVIGAEDGVEGVELARKHLPDLIISDIMMPRGSGDWVLKELRQDPSTLMIPFIFLSAKSNRSDVRDGMELGADDYIPKPFTPDELLSAVHTQLEKLTTMTQEHEIQLADFRQNVITAIPHELRTPLTVILGHTRMLIEDKGIVDQEDIVRIASSIDRNAQRMYRLIDNYLLYSQLELLRNNEQQSNSFRQNHIEKPSISIQAAATSKCKEYGRLSDLQMNITDTTIQSSDEDLSKIVLELVDNACKFSTSGTAIEIYSETNGRFWVMSVVDHGRGMIEDEIRQVGAYMQFDRRIYEHAGLGLGLVIARELAELQGGHLTIESRPSNTYIRVAIPQFL